MSQQMDERTLVIEQRAASLDSMPIAAVADVLLLALARRRPDTLILEPEDGGHVVRAELPGGASTVVATMSAAHGDAVAARLVLLAGLDVAMPSQIGRLRYRVREASGDGEEVDLLILPRATPSGLAVELRPLRSATRSPSLVDASEAPSVGPAASPDAPVAPYRLLSELGRGGMGIVYRAEHVLLQKHVALKVLGPGLAEDADMIAHFLVEARAACRARHPGIVDVTDFGWLPDGRVFYVMELVEAETLDAVIARERALPPHRAIVIARQIADVLRAASASGIVHRDLKPGNVFVLRGDLVKVGDFGLARIVSGMPLSRRTLREGRLVPIGTPGYMSPEQGRGEAVDARSDIYSLGCALFEMLTGRLPYTANNMFAIVEQHQSAPIPPVIGPEGRVPEMLAAVVRRAMAKRREERHQSAEELSADLDRAERALQRTGWRRWLPT